MASSTRCCWLLLIAFGCLAVLSTAAAAAAKQGSGVRATGELIDLNEDNWQTMLNGEWMIEFFAPWCPACKNLAPTWELFASQAKAANVHVAKIDVTTSPSLSGRFFVTALPTIYHVKDGEFRQYRGARHSDDLLFFVEQRQWTKLEPLSSWKKPDTVHMSVLSYFFKLSHTLKDFNARLQDEYGLPPWGSYALFAIGTIFVGAALGLMLVCLVDLVYPPKKSPRQSFSETQDDNVDEEGVENLATEDIEDDDGVENEAKDNEEDDDESAEDEDAEEEEHDTETSDAEKNSHSESEPEADKKIGDVASKTNKINDDVEATDKQQGHEDNTQEQETAKTEVRKRKPRKAD